MISHGQKINIQVIEFIEQLDKITRIAADSVQTIANNCTDLFLTTEFHHLLELGTVGVAAGKALVLKNKNILRLCFRIMQHDITAAELHLIFDALSLAGKT